MPESYAPKLPLETDENDKFIYITDALQNAKQKLKTILLTSPGEKIYDPEFGMGIRRYLFEPNIGIITNSASQTRPISVSSFKNDLEIKLASQTSRFSPDINIDSVLVQVYNDKLEIEIQYTFSDAINDSITITVGTQ